MFEACLARLVDTSQISCRLHWSILVENSTCAGPPGFTEASWEMEGKEKEMKGSGSSSAFYDFGDLLGGVSAVHWPPVTWCSDLPELLHPGCNASELPEL
jgi:hypothetical protein